MMRPHSQDYISRSGISCTAFFFTAKTRRPAGLGAGKMHAGLPKHDVRGSLCKYRAFLCLSRAIPHRNLASVVCKKVEGEVSRVANDLNLSINPKRVCRKGDIKRTQSARDEERR